MRTSQSIQTRAPSCRPPSSVSCPASGIVELGRSSVPGSGMSLWLDIPRGEAGAKRMDPGLLRTADGVAREANWRANWRANWKWKVGRLACISDLNDMHSCLYPNPRVDGATGLPAASWLPCASSSGNKWVKAC